MMAIVQMFVKTVRLYDMIPMAGLFQKAVNAQVQLLQQQ